MITLFIDTSTDTLSVAVFKDDKLLSSEYVVSKDHSSNSLLKIKELFEKNNLDPMSVAKIMIINGPGSFTGLRIGVTIAKIYAWACKAKVIPISTLRAYALSYDYYNYYVPVIDARRDFVYGAIYNNEHKVVMIDSYISKKELLEKVEKLDNALVIGDTNIGDYESVSKKINVEKVYECYKNDKGINPHLLNPIYLKQTEAEEKLGDKMIREYNEKDFNSVCILGRDINLDYIFKLSTVGKCYVYDNDGEVVGFAIVDLFEDRSELIDICVALAHRNKKIGRKLLEKVIEVSTKNGCKSISLEVRCDNDFAIKLYKSLGFKTSNIRKKYYSKGSVDAYVMHRELL